MQRPDLGEYHAFKEVPRKGSTLERDQGSDCGLEYNRREYLLLGRGSHRRQGD